MKLNDKKNKRLGVFVFFDKDGIVDDYVLYLLESLKDATDDIIIVSNSYLSPSERKKLNDFIFDSDIGNMVCDILDSKFRVASEDNIVISYEYDSMVEKNVANIDNLTEVYNKLTDSNKKFAIISDEVWNEEKQN